MSTSLDDLRKQAEAWRESDPDAGDRAELEALRGREDELSALRERFCGRLEFGTAGLRGVIGAGESRMNLAVVLQTTDGLARAWASDEARRRGVVIGYDGRHRSEAFAHAAAEVLLAHGYRVYLFEHVGPTPLTAFALADLGAAGAVMVTASHNPPEYNGYKVYSVSGAQIVPPEDEAIAQAIAKAPPANRVPRRSLTEGGTNLVRLGTAMVDRYAAAASALVPQGRAGRELSIVYTAMHGVGAPLAERVLTAAGFSAVHSVSEQRDPDPNFRTVAFPNPEEPGAMDLAFRDARAHAAELILANDPDADRLAVAVPDALTGNYVQLTGNQVGVLLGHAELMRVPSAERAGVSVLASCVSSPMLGAIATRLGATYEETLTGFKWIAHRARQLEQTAHKRFIFGYEEALGYTIGTLVRDKDGISAALAFAELAAGLKAQGKSVLTHWEDLVREYGLYASSQVNVTRKGPEGARELAALMQHLRSNPPRTLLDFTLTHVRDLQAGVETHCESGVTSNLTMPRSNVLIYSFGSDLRVIARPSGTEPKAKFYFDLRQSVGTRTMAEANHVARARLMALEEAFRHHAGVAS